MRDGCQCFCNADKPAIPHTEACPVHVVRSGLLPVRTTRRNLCRSAFGIIPDFDIKPAVTASAFAKILAGTLIVGLLLLLAGAVAVVGLDALFQISDETIVGVLDDRHSFSSNPTP